MNCRNRVSLLPLLLSIALLSFSFLFYIEVSTSLRIETSSPEIMPAVVRKPTKREFGYTDVIDLYKYSPDLKVIKLDSSSSVISAEVEVTGEIERVDDFIKFLRNKENFSGINKFVYTEVHLGHPTYTISVEFLKSQ